MWYWIGSGILFIAILWLTVGPMFVINLVLNFLGAFLETIVGGLGDADW